MKDYKYFETKAVRYQSDQSYNKEHSVPIYATSSFLFDNAEEARALFDNEIKGNIYTRFSNPNNEEFITKLCLLEGLEDGVATSSGMAAMFLSIASFLEQGDHLIASRAVLKRCFSSSTGFIWGCVSPTNK